MTSPTIIPLSDHPHNLDQTAVLVTGPRDPQGIYKVQAGYVACLRDQLTFDCTFPTMEAARKAQATVG